MDPSDTAKVQVLNVVQSRQDDRQNVLKSAISTVAALKRLLADYDRLQAERNDFERAHARVLLQNNTLRKQAKEATEQRELLLRALETLTTQMDAIGASCIETAKTARAQSIDSAPLVPASEPPNEADPPPQMLDPAKWPTAPSAANTECAPAVSYPPPQMPNVLDPAKWPTAPSAANTECAPAVSFLLSQCMSE